DPARGRPRRARGDPPRRGQIGSSPHAASAILPAMSWWDHFSNVLLTWGPLAFMGLIAFFLWRTVKLMPRTKPQEITPDSASSVKWGEVAGVEQAKAELREVVEFLTDPQRFRKLGAKVPK